MTTPTPSEPLELRQALEAIGPLPLDPDWMYTVIRHGQRNMDIDVRDGFNEPDRQCGGSVALIVNSLPALLDRLEAQASTIEALEAENTTMRRILKSARRDLEGIYSGSEGPITTAKSNRLCARRIEAGGALRALILDLSTLREEKEG